MIVAHNLGDAETLQVLTRGEKVKGPQQKMYVAPAELTPRELELQAATLARNYDAMFTRNGAPFAWPKNVPLGKYSFVVRDGVRHYVPFSAADIERFGRSPYAKIKRGYKCPDKRLRQIIKRKAKRAAEAARKYPSTDPRHIRHIFPGDLFCKPKDDNPLEKIATAAAVVTGAVFFGPQILSTVGGAAKSAIGVGGKLIGAAAKAAPLAEKIINGKRVTDALAAGEAPPPPISIGDGSLSDYAQLVAQQMLERDLARGATDAEKAELYRLIEQQRLQMAALERPHLPVVNSGLAPAVTEAQRQRADQATGSSDLLKILAIGIPAAVLLWRSA